MGLSTPIATSIVFIGVLAFVSTVFGLLVDSAHTLIELSSRVDELRSVYTRIEISDVSVSNNTVKFLVKNLGPRTIHLIRYENYSWCSVIISYNTTLGWTTYLIEDYIVENITILGSNVTFSPSQHPYINPGEGAWILARLPEEAPEIPVGSPVVVVFSTRFGETATYEVVRIE